jgi:hypothetical protein
MPPVASSRRNSLSRVSARAALLPGTADGPLPVYGSDSFIPILYAAQEIDRSISKRIEAVRDGNQAAALSEDPSGSSFGNGSDRRRFPVWPIALTAPPSFLHILQHISAFIQVAGRWRNAWAHIGFLNSVPADAATATATATLLRKLQTSAVLQLFRYTPSSALGAPR